ncbi:hypothetical protein [Natronoflexus pectinivorans]|uniref:Uncharacterized protein n=1 Tax=Natronoflexus pectinivorans TaxID=682526 RepID=A0A4R2GMJ7_9BACT|nr:hypothetical protein [Natronoflexus pectinivorans]TCO08823.1 hypothetical protein EV194_104134 [Natronoflexus pectinivorans]
MRLKTEGKSFFLVFSFIEGFTTTYVVVKQVDIICLYVVWIK